jgi:hypothetical protein
VQGALKDRQVIGLQDGPASLVVLLPVGHHGGTPLGNLARRTICRKLVKKPEQQKQQ